MNDAQERIRQRAHAIWEAQGHPEGLADEHWRQAEAELAETDSGEALPNPLASGAAAEQLAKPRRRKATPSPTA